MSRERIDPSSRLPVAASPAPAVRRLCGPRSGYVELFARTNFSFLQAGSSPEAIVNRAAELGQDAVGIVDRDGLYGIVRAHEQAATAAVRIVVGCELTIDDDSPWSLLVHVETHAGYINLCRVLTVSHARHPRGRPQTHRGDGESLPRNLRAGILIETLLEHADGLWCTTLDATRTGPVALLKSAFGARLSVGVHRHLDGDDEARVARAVALCRAHDAPVVVHNAVRYAVSAHKPVLDVLQCIREGMTLDAAGRALSPNAEARMKGYGELSALFADHPEWIARTRQIAEACRFSMKELAYRFPCDSDLEGETPDAALRRKTYEGAALRYPGGLPEKVQLQIDKELGVIGRLEVAPYFLSVESIVQMARRRDILCQGRGSAANSAVCFCLGVTAVDPARSNLLFERFLSEERREPPDIDVDFEHERREEVIQEIYARYGRDRAAMVSEVIAYRGKSALKDVAKVFGFSLEQSEQLASLVSGWDGPEKIAPATLIEAGFDPSDTRVSMCISLAKAIEGYPRHLSIHVGGFVLSAAPLHEVAPVEPAAMAGRTVIAWDKDDIDALGFFKVDVLALGMLTAIRKAMDFVSKEGSAIDRLARIPAEDPAVYDALCAADTVGVFQIESRAQMSMLPRLRPRCFYDLVIQVAIVRPGPIQGGMVHPFLRRRSGEEPIDPPHECLRPILERTLGVPLFQEQVMQIAIVGAGYTGGEADQLRRDMAAWKKTGRLASHKERLEKGFIARGISPQFAERLYKQIHGFGEYGFPESHAASFALLVYASAWLKVHHPAAFAAALVNSQPMGFYSANTLLEDARRHGVTIRPIDVARSDWDCTLEMGDIRLGLRQVKGLGEETGLRIQTARMNRAFSSIEDLRARASVPRAELSALAEAGAMGALVEGRRRAIWAAREPEHGALFRGVSGSEPAPDLPRLSRIDQLVLDFDRTGLSVTDHPMRALRSRLSPQVLSSEDVARTAHGARVTAGGLVICRQRPGTASGVVFVTLEDEFGFINLVLWARVFDRLRKVVTSSQLMLASGTVERSKLVPKVGTVTPQSTIHLIVESLSPMTMWTESVAGMSRNFR